MVDVLASVLQSGIICINHEQAAQFEPEAYLFGKSGMDKVQVCNLKPRCIIVNHLWSMVQNAAVVGYMNTLSGAHF